MDNKETLETANDKLTTISHLLEGQNQIAGHEKLIQAYDATLDMLVQHFAKMIRENVVPGGNELLQHLKQILSQTELFRDYPELLGDTVIGVMGCPGRIMQQIDDEIVGNWAEKGKTIPVIWTHADTEQVVAENMYDQKIPVTEEELQRIFDLAKDEMDISQLLQLLCVYRTQISVNKTVIDIPCGGSLALRKKLVPKLDVLYVYYKNYTMTKLKEMLQELKHYRVDIKVILPIKSPKNIDQIKAELVKIGISVLGEREVKQSVKAYEASKNNFSFVDMMRAALAPYEGRYVVRQSGVKENLEALKRDAVQMKDGKTEKTVQALLAQTKAEQQLYDKRTEHFLRASEKLLQAAEELEKEFSHEANDTAGTKGALKIRKYMGSIWANLTFSYLRIFKLSHEIKYYKKAESYLKKVESAGLEESYWLQMVWNATFDQNILTRQDKTKLQKCDYHQYPDIASALLYLHHLGKIKLQPKKLLDVVVSIKEPQGSVENFYKGYYYEQILKPNQAVDYYLSAWKSGEEKALQKLIALKDLVNKRGEFLSFEKEDAYRIGVEKIKMKSKASQEEGLFYLKVAAANENIKAIEYLGEYYYNQHTRENRVKNAAWKNENELLTSMFMYIRKRDRGFKKADFYIGMLAYEIKDYQKAITYLKDQTEPEALALLASMYYYGQGTSVNKQHAEMFARKASQQGQTLGADILRKIQREKEAAAEEQRRRSVPVEETQPYHEIHDTSSDSCCALVTATCNALQIEHRIYHRTVYFIRHLRNKAVEMTVENQDLAAAYYIYASDVVARINAQPRAVKIYEHFWKDYIMPCVADTRKRDYVKAWKLYVKMTYLGCVKYNVELPYFIRREAEAVLK